MNKYLLLSIALISMTACTRPTESQLCKKYAESKKGTDYESPNPMTMQLDPKDIYDIAGKPHLKVGNEYYEIKMMTADEWLKQYSQE